MRRSRTALITGAGGFCATHLATRLASGHRCTVVGLSIDPRPLHDAGLADYVRCDVSDTAAVRRIIRRVKPDWLFHLAGISSGSRKTVFAVNASGTVNVLTALVTEHPAAAAVIVGSAAEYGSVPRSRLPITEDQLCRPSTAYGASKYAATRAALRLHRTRGLKVVVARPFNMIGALMPPSLVLGAVLERIRCAIAVGERPARVMVGPTDARRDFVLVEDVCAALIRMARGDHWGEVFNLCSGEPTEIRTLLRMIAHEVNWPIRYVRDYGIAKSRGPAVSYGSFARAAQAFGFAPSPDLGGAIRRLCRLELKTVGVTS